METKKLNLFIVDSNKLISNLLNRLKAKFGETLNIIRIDNKHKLLQKIDKLTDVDDQTDIIVLYNQEDNEKEKESSNLSNLIKAIKPKARVILIINENESEEFNAQFC